jgi:hypothetical protein
MCLYFIHEAYSKLIQYIFHFCFNLLGEYFIGSRDFCNCGQNILNSRSKGFCRIHPENPFIVSEEISLANSIKSALAVI